jgi:hypothetical protein
MLLEHIRKIAGINRLHPVTDEAPLPTTPLGRPIPGAALTITTGNRAQLAAGVTRISLRNTGTVAATYRLGGADVTAGATDDDIGPGERIDIAVRDGEYLAVSGATIKVTQLGA